MPIPSCHFTPLNLPPSVLEGLLGIAKSNDVLFLGELHGTQEVPRLVSGLLDHLQQLGYGALALELPRHEQEELLRYMKGESRDLPNFFTYESDGKANQQFLSLLREAFRKGWSLECFDCPGLPDQREEEMAAALAHICKAKKVLVITGSLHSRTATPAHDTQEAVGFSVASTSAANLLKKLKPDLAIRSVAIVFHEGSYMNYGRKIISPSPIESPYISTEPEVNGHAFTLHLPRATPADLSGRRDYSKVAKEYFRDF